MARRIRPLLAHVGSLLDPKPPVHSMFARDPRVVDRFAERARAEAAAAELDRRDIPEEDEDGDAGGGGT